MLMSIPSKGMSKTSSQIISTDPDELLVQGIPSSTIVPTGKLIRLETADTIVFFKLGMNHRLKIPVINNSKHEQNTIRGRLQQISHITPLLVK